MSLTARSRRLLLSVLAVVVVAAAVALAAGLATARADSPAPAASPDTLTLRIGWTSQPDNLNPFIGWQNVTYEIWSINYDFLFGFGNDNSPTLDLAREFPTEENGGISADGKVWTIKLRTGRQVVGRAAVHRRGRRLHVQLHRQERDDDDGDHHGRHQGRQGAGARRRADQLHQAQGRHDAHLPADPAQTRLGGRGPEGGADQLRQRAAHRGHRSLHHDRVQEGQPREDGAQPLLLGHDADARRAPLRVLHQRRHHDRRPRSQEPSTPPGESPRRSSTRSPRWRGSSRSPTTSSTGTTSA